jgi:hypothetical protein
MTVKLYILAIVLGLGVALPQLYGIMKPVESMAALRRFPRSLPWGWALMLLGTGWFLYNLSQESIADFASYKNLLFAGFAAVGIGSCVFIRDFLAVRGLAVVFLLLAKLMVDTGRPHLSQTSWVLVIQGWAYVMVLAGMWLTVSPWRLRDLVQWSTANEKRFKTLCAVRLGFGLMVAVLGITVF